MDLETVRSNVKFAMGTYDPKRVDACNDCNNRLLVTLDLHFLQKSAAKRCVQNAIGAVPRGNGFTLKVIHGHNHGTILREMILNELKNERIIKRQLADYDEGTTLIEVA